MLYRSIVAESNKLLRFGEESCEVGQSDGLNTWARRVIQRHNRHYWLLNKAVYEFISSAITETGYLGSKPPSNGFYLIPTSTQGRTCLRNQQQTPRLMPFLIINRP